MTVFSVREINARAADPARFIEECERAYTERIVQAADAVMRSERPLVLLCGPSGSGKTTTAQRIEAVLDAHGHETHVLSFDNYFIRDAQHPVPLDEQGVPDLESPLCLDAALLQEHFARIAQGLPFDMPVFDFAAQRRSDQTIPLRLRKGDLVIMEGIHALNPAVVGEQTLAEHAFTLYVAPRTRIADDSGLLLHPSKLRLARRLMRDLRGRGTDFHATVERLRSVSRGERLYILPHKPQAQFEMDTFFPYEACLYRSTVLDGLEALGAPWLEEQGVGDLVPLLRQLTPIRPDLIPENSMIREFIG